jgi:hypothetical protein
MLEESRRTRHPGCPPAPSPGRARSDADRAGYRVEALEKLKALFDSGVLTRRQFADERQRLLDE